MYMKKRSRDRFGFYAGVSDYFWDSVFTNLGNSVDIARFEPQLSGLLLKVGLSS